MIKLAGSPSLSERTADVIFDLIVNQKKYLPGDRIPGENVLSVDLGVSRTTLREAERILVAKGILEIHRGRGVFVSEGAAHYHSVDFSDFERLKIQAKDLYELRLIFEPSAAKRACCRALDSERQAIIRQGEHVTDLIRANSPWQDADQMFHQAIIRAAHNDFMSQLIPFINRAFYNGIQISKDSGLLAQIPLKDNPDICYAFETKNADLAETAMSMHIQHVIQVLHIGSFHTETV